MNDKKVILTMEEYEKLKADSDALKMAKEELKKDSKERGYYVEFNIPWERLGQDHYYNNRYITRMEPIKIFTRDEALELAQSRVDEAHADVKALLDKVEGLERRYERLSHRNFFQRLFNIR